MKKSIGNIRVYNSFWIAENESKKEIRTGRKRKDVFKISGDEMSDESDSAYCGPRKHSVHKGDH